MTNNNKRVAWLIWRFRNGCPEFRALLHVAARGHGGGEGGTARGMDDQRCCDRRE